MYNLFLVKQISNYLFFNCFYNIYNYIHPTIIFVLKSILKFLVLVFFFLNSITNIYAQKFELSIYAKKTKHIADIESIPYNKYHNTKNDIFIEVDTFSKKLLKLGYINNVYKLIEKDSLISCEFTLHEKIELVRVFYQKNLITKNYLSQLALNVTDNYFDIPFNDIETTLNLIVEHFENLGNSFTTVHLNNISNQNELLTAQLHINISKKRTINNIVIKGYLEFPKKYLKHHLKINKNTTFNLNYLNKLNKDINTIPFINQINKPQVLFTKDSTTLYLYFKKKSNSSFDGIIGFSNEESSGKLKFNGQLELNLNNILNKGESFFVKWENNQQETSSLALNFKSPYIFNSPINFSGGFSIFKQDTSYVNTKGSFTLGYSLKNRNIITLIGITEKSNLPSTINNNPSIRNFSKNLVGISYSFNILETSKYINTYKFNFNTNILIGNRTSNNTITTQNSFEFTINYTLHFNLRNALFLKTAAQILNTKNPFENELYRIGGINSIRGFNQQSILTPKYNVTNLEYHYTLNNDSYLYSITDFAILNDINTKNTTQLYGLGLGYYLNTKNTILDFSYAVGSNYNTLFNINNSKIHIKMVYPF